MPASSTFDYAMIRVVPRVEREEFLNVGVIVFCATQRFLKARIELDYQRLAAFAPTVDFTLIEEHLRTIPLICEGGTQAGPIGQTPQMGRFHWLVAPRSTIIQTSPVHCGLCEDPEAALGELFRKMVLPPPNAEVNAARTATNTQPTIDSLDTERSSA